MQRLIRNIILLASLVAATSAGAQRAPARRAPGVSALRALGQWVVSTGTAFAVGTVGYSIGSSFSSDRVKGDAGYNPTGNLGFAVGSWIGAGVGAWAVGATERCARGSFGKALLGAALPAALLVAAHDDPYAFIFGGLLLVPLEGVGATIAYNHSRRLRVDRPGCG